MAVYKIADLKIAAFPKSEYAEKLMHPYLCNDEEFDFSADAAISQIEYEKHISGVDDVGVCEFTAIFRNICHTVLTDFNGMFMHSSAIKYNGRAYLFVALPGTGKTTHTMLWKKAFGNKVEIINGDKPLLRTVGKKIIVYGNPWQGKENLGSDISAELGGVFILKRGKQNRVTEASPIEVLPNLLNATVKPANSDESRKLFEFLNLMADKASVYLLECNMNIEAAFVTEKAIRKGV